MMSALPPDTTPAAAPWKVRYWSIFVGQAFSLIGSGLTQFVLLWWITDITGSVSALGLAALMVFLPQALLGPVAGICADRYSRRFILIGADLINAVCMAVLIGLFLNESIEIWHAYVMMGIRSAMQAFQGPAANASTAMLVPESFVPRAAGLNQTLYGLMVVGAAPLGALAISVLPIGWALSIDVFTALLGIGPLLVFKIPQEKLDRTRGLGFWAEFKEGAAVVWNEPGLRRLYALMGAIGVVLMPTFTLNPLLIKGHFGGGAEDVAIMESAGGIGMLLGGALVALCAPKRRISWGLWGFALSCFGFALTAAMPSGHFALAVCAWVFSSLTYSLGNGPLASILQTAVPNWLQGRVLSLMSTLMGFAAPLGLLIATPLGELIGVRWLFIVVGCVSGLITLVGFFSPHLMRFDDEGARIHTPEPPKDLPPSV